MNHRVWAGLAVVIALVFACDGPERADDVPSGGGGLRPGASFEPEVTIDRAEDVALQTVGGGQVLETSVDDIDDVVRVWEVKVLDSEGERREVSVDMATGAVLGNELDD